MRQTTKLAARFVEKPWGRIDVPPTFGVPPGRRIGEIWFEGSSAKEAQVLSKYLFTGEQLSVQVHPNDRQAEQAGAARGKTECWYVLAAEDGARIGLGFSEPVTREQVQEAALNGSIEQMLCWREVRPGDFVFVPAGTVHAIGAGLTIVELQQNSDVTYRIFDYGRPRQLHLNEGLAVAKLEPADPPRHPAGDSAEDCILISVPQFTVVRASTQEGASWMIDRERWVLPISGSAVSDGEQAAKGECLLVPPGRRVELSDASVALIAAVGEFSV